MKWFHSFFKLYWKTKHGHWNIGWEFASQTFWCDLVLGKKHGDDSAFHEVKKIWNAFVKFWGYRNCAEMISEFDCDAVQGRFDGGSKFVFELLIPRLATVLPGRRRSHSLLAIHSLKNCYTCINKRVIQQKKNSFEPHLHK